MANEQAQSTSSNVLVQRFIGALVLIVAGLILWPFLFPANEERTVITQALEIPEKPKQERFEVELDEELPLEEQALNLPSSDNSEDINTVATGQIERDLESIPETKDQSSQNLTPTVTEVSPVATKPAVKKTSPVLAQAWLLQVGNFTSQENANRLVLEAQQKGFKVYSRTEKGDDGKLHTKVLLGPKLDREQAEKKKIEIEEKLGLKSFLVEFKPGDKFFKVNFND